MKIKIKSYFSKFKNFSIGSNVTKRAISNSVNKEYVSFDLKPSILNISNKENKLQLPRTSNHIENSQRRKKQKSTKFMKKVNSSSMHQVYGLSPEIDTLQSSVVERLAFKSFVVDNQII